MLLKPFFYGIAFLLLFSLIVNFWQVKHPKTITTTDTLTVVINNSPDTVISEIVKWKTRTIDITDTSLIDSLSSVLDSVMNELEKGEVREYTDNVRFDTGDSLEVKLKGVLFDGIHYYFFPVPDTIRYITNTVTIREGNDTWFSLVPAIGVLEANGKLGLSGDLFLMFPKYGLGVTCTYDPTSKVLSKGIKVAKVWNVTRILLF